MASSKMVELNWNPNERTLRQFGFIALFGFGVLGAFAYFEVLMFGMGLGSAREPVAYTLFALGGLGLVFSLVYPKANRLLYVGTSVIAYPIGFVLSYVILGFLFFGIIAPIGLVMRAFGHDPMERGFVRDRVSYWNDMRRARAKDSYFRQF